MTSPSATQDRYPYQNEPIWLRSEKAPARTAFDAALKRAPHEVIQETKQMANEIQQSSDLWDLEHYLTQRRKPDTSRTLHLKRVGSHLRSTVPALTRSATPAFKHTINVVANCVSGIHAAKSLHKKAIVFCMPVADGCHHRRS